MSAKDLLGGIAVIALILVFGVGLARSRACRSAESVYEPGYTATTRKMLVGSVTIPKHTRLTILAVREDDAGKLESVRVRAETKPPQELWLSLGKFESLLRKW